MPNVMESDRLDAGLRTRAAPATAEVFRLRRCADSGGEDEPVILLVLTGRFTLRALSTLVIAQGRDAQLRQWHGADRLIRLGRDEAQFSGDPLDRLDHHAVISSPPPEDEMGSLKAESGPFSLR